MTKILYPIFKLPSENEDDVEYQAIPTWIKWWLLNNYNKKHSWVLSEIITGNPLTLENSVATKFYLPPLPRGNSDQVQYSGKNKFKTVTSYTGYGIQVTKNDDGSITINGTASTEFNLEIINESLKAGNYTLQCKYQGTLPNISVTRCQVYSASGNFLMQIMNNASSATVVNKSLGSDVTDVKFRFLIQANFNYNNVKFYPYLVEGTYTENTMPEFEPYVGGTASPNPSYPQEITNVTGDVEVLVQNKNLAWNGWAEDFVERVNNNTLAKIETKDSRNCVYYTANVSYNAYDTRYIFKPKGGFKENTQYTFSFDILKTSSTNRTFAILYTDGTTTTNNIVSSVNTWEHQTVTSVANKTILAVISYFTSGETYIDLDTFMGEQNTTATTYTPHKEQTYTFPLGTQRMYLGDYLADDGIHHVRKQIELSTLSYTEYYSNRYRTSALANSIKKPATSFTVVDVLCNKYIKSYESATLTNGLIAIGTNGTMYINDETGSPSGIIEYPLEQEEITPYTTEQQQAYDEIKQAISYDEQTNISGTSDEAEPLFKVQYYMKNESEGE